MDGFLKKALSAWLAIVLLVTQSVFSPAVAQTQPDVESPVIELEAIAEADAGTTQVFTAQVADDRLLKDVTLYHRRAGRQAFERASMLPLGTTGYYSVELTTDPSDLRTIEYYVQARDQGGNRSVSGYAFDPYQRTINAAAPVIATAPVTRPTVKTIEATPESASETGKIKWWQIALGALVLGAVASASGGSSGEGTEKSELIINLPLPQ